MPFEPRLFSGADGNPDGSHFVDPAMAESHPAAMNGASQRATSMTARLHGAGPFRSVPAEVDADADLELPDQLAMLAAQLRDEAERLAARHSPPEGRTVEPIRDGKRGRRFARYAAILLVAIGLVAWRSLVPRGWLRPNAATVASGPAVHDSAATTAAAAAQVTEPLSTARAASSSLVKSSATVATARKSPAAGGSDPESLRAGQGIAEVGAGETPIARHPPADENEMLRRQVEGFDKLIHRLQAELAVRDAAQVENEKLIQSLRQENEQSRRQQR